MFCLDGIKIVSPVGQAHFMKFPHFFFSLFWLQGLPIFTKDILSITKRFEFFSSNLRL